MRKILIALLLLSTFLVSYNGSTKEKDEATVSHTDTLKQENSNTKQDTLKPVFGYRFVINGDFDGDGKKEKLIEHFVSGIDNKETNKFYEGLTDYEQLIELTVKKNPISFVVSDNKRIDTLHIFSGGQQLGLSYLKNEGDLNGDGTDEVSYVINWADQSNINTWHLVSYKNNKWTEIYSFPIWDWQLPDLPQTCNQYGLFGLDNKIINTNNDTVNIRLEKELINFKGLVKKIKTNKIQVIFMNEAAEEDTMIVDLKQLK